MSQFELKRRDPSTVTGVPSDSVAFVAGNDGKLYRKENTGSAVEVGKTTAEIQSQIDESTRNFESTCRCNISHVITEDTSLGPRIIEFFGGYLWGVLSGDIYRSDDEGVTWDLYCNSWPDTGADAFIARIIPTSDGEVIVTSQTKIRKSSNWAGGNAATWSVPKVVPNASCVFPGPNIDGDGTKFILGEYSTTWPDSRYVHISLDAGNTWFVAYDSVDLHGETAADATHIHGVCYDPFGDRFYIGEGHGIVGGVYVSSDDGNTWTLINRDAFSMGGENYNAPTVIIATDDGLVMGSDHGANGLFGLIRKDDPTTEVPFITLPIKTGREGLVMFAQRGWRDPSTGEVYVTFRSEFNDVRPCICVGTPRNGSLLYEWPTLPVVGGSDRFVFAARVSDERLVAYCEFNFTPTTLRGNLAPTTQQNVYQIDDGNLIGGKAHPTSVSTGQRSVANGIRSVANGVGASTGSFADAVAIGSGSSVTANNGIVVGKGSSAGGSSVVIGVDIDGGALNVILGDGSTAASIHNVNLGVGTKTVIRSVAVGAFADAKDFADSVALGAFTYVTGPFQVQLGQRHIELIEMETPDAAPANALRFFARDNGSGKTQLCVRFQTGEVQVIATEP